MSKIKIDKGIKMPPIRGDIGWTTLFLSMKIGESILVDKRGHGGIKGAAQKNNGKVIVRKQNDKFRIWRAG